MPNANHDYWQPKLARNVERDRQNDRDLSGAGWTVMRFFEHVDPKVAAEQVDYVVRAA